MGIRGLTNYVDHIRPSIWTSIDLKDTKVIIDGLGLLYYLQGNIESRFGGQYDTIANAIEHFFTCFKKNNVKTYVILDGPTVAVDKKLSTLRDRAQTVINRCYDLSKGASDETVDPPFAMMLLVQKLQGLEIPFVVCDREADQEIASLANLWNCPVISNDSDFFIYDLPAGYIPLTHLRWTEYLLHARRLYYREKLSQHLKVQPGLLPLLASLLGNDFVGGEVLAPFEKALQRILPWKPSTRIAKRLEKICRFLATTNTPDDAKSTSTNPDDDKSTTPNDAKSTTPDDAKSTTPDDDKSTTPDDAKSTTPDDAKSTTPDDDKSTTPDDAKSTSTNPDDDKSTTPNDAKSTTPDDAKSTTPDDAKSTTPDDDKSTTPDDAKSTTPDDAKSTTPDDDKSTTPDDAKSTTPDDDKSTTLDDALQSVLAIINKDSERTSLEKALLESMAEYKILGAASTLASYFESGVIQSRLENVPAYVINRYRHGNFPVKYLGVISRPRNILKKQVENMNETSANNCSLILRQVIYAIILTPSQSVMEWDRDGLELKECQVQTFFGPVKGYGDLPSLQSLPELDANKRREFLLSILESKTAAIQSLPVTKQLFAASIRYWILHATPQVTQRSVQALILQFLQQRKSTEKKEQNIVLQHNLAQWQSVMFETLHLNKILLDAFPEPDLSKLFNGVAVHYIMYELKQGKPPECFNSPLTDFVEIYDAVQQG